MTHESGVLAGPGLLIHGGAGSFSNVRSPTDAERLGAAMEAALAVAWEALARGGTALDAAVEAVAAMEDSGMFNAGPGSARNTRGQIETDAAVMDGATGAAGAICAATWAANPVRAARLVAALDHRTGGPVLLAAGGADQLAESAGLPRMRPAGSVAGGVAGGSGAGTVGAVAVDAAGHVAAATSTGGREGQRPGRVGDSPIIGAGTWADDATVAVSATGIGEAFMLAGFAHRVDWLLRGGADVDRAVIDALTAVAERGGTGGAITVTPSGRFAVRFDTRAMARGWRDASTCTVGIAGIAGGQ